MKVKLAEEAEDYQSGPLSFFDEEKKSRYVPYVIEPSAGMDRSTLAFLVDAYDEEEVRGEVRNVLRFHPALAPTKVAIFPLVKKEGMPEIARNIYDDLKKYMTCFYDEKGGSAGGIDARTRRARRTASPSTATRSRTAPSPSASATAWSNPGSRSTRSRRICAKSWTCSVRPVGVQP
jgi:glycyl-tRNA synthetase